MFKYRIKELLDKLPHSEYNETVNTLVTILDVSRSTFNDWKNLTLKDPRDIPTQKLFIIAAFFKVSPLEMPHYEISVQEGKVSITQIQYAS